MNVTLEMVDFALLGFFCLSHCLFAVPVVVVFTKCDALLATAIGKLTPEEKKLPPAVQLSKMKEHVKEMLRNSTAWERLKTRKYPPKAYVYLESKSRDPVVL